MNKIENLALELAMLSNRSLYQLADVMQQHYPTRLDALEQAVQATQQESFQRTATELGIA
jgi:hypothetical protein